MTPAAFQNCMQGLLAMAPRGRDVTEKALEIYWDRLFKQGYSDEDLQAGCNKVIDTHHWRAFPTIAEIIEACEEARQVRLTRDYENQKKEEARYRALTPEQMLERGRKKSPEIQALIHNTQALLRNEIDLPTWCAGQKLILQDDTSKVAIHRIENRILAQRTQGE